MPSHIFKVILVIPKEKKKTKEGENDKTKPKTHLLGAFLVPNEKIPENKVLTDFEVPLDYLEKLTGMIFIYFLFFLLPFSCTIINFLVLFFFFTQ